jgi:octopine/nopaline transport system permease protein
MDLDLILDTFGKLLGGAVVTIELIAPALAIGVILAMVLAVMRMSGNGILSRISRAYVFVFRGTPLLVQIFLIYFGLGQFRPLWEALGVWDWPLREAFPCAVIAFAMNTAAYTSEIIRGGLQAVPFGQIEAARACGMSRSLVFRRITVPIAIRQALPAYGNEIILMVKASSLASIITIMEITGIAKQINSRTFAPFEVFTAAGILYLVMNFVVAQGVRAVEWKLTPHLRRRQH